MMQRAFANMTTAELQKIVSDSYVPGASTINLEGAQNELNRRFTAHLTPVADKIAEQERL
jgi:hypothetical protein